MIALPLRSLVPTCCATIGDRARTLSISIIDVGQSARTSRVVLFAPLPVKLFPGTIREPDVLYVKSQNLPLIRKATASGLQSQVRRNGAPRRVDATA